MAFANLNYEPMQPVSTPNRLVQVQPARVKLAEYDRQDWVCNAEHGTTLEDCMRPEYWAHMAERFQPYDSIEIRAEDGSWLAKAIVLGCDRNWAKIALLHKYEFSSGDIQSATASSYSLKWCGPQKKWGFIRTSDGAVIRDGFASKDQAAEEMLSFERTVS